MNSLSQHEDQNTTILLPIKFQEFVLSFPKFEISVVKINDVLM